MIVSTKSNGSPVLSVNFQIGNIVLDKEDIGLSNVDNTTDINKPISSATQTALNNKVNIESGKELTTNDLTDTLKEHYDEAYSKEHDHINKSSLDLVSGTNTGDQDLSGKSDITHNHNLNDLTEKSYNSLTNKPTIPSAQINSDWNAVGTIAEILNKPIIPDELADLSDDSTHRPVTDTEKGIWSGKQDALGYTPENIANLRTTFQITPDDTHYISEKLAKDSLNTKLEAGAVSVSYAPANPTGLTGTGTYMFGLGNTLKITPLKTGKIKFFINFIPTGSGTTTSLSTYQLAYGTGIAPSNGAVATGTNFDTSDSGSNYVASVNAPQYTHTHCFIISGLVVGTAYWFDVKGTKAVGATNVGMSKIRCTIEELPY